MVSTLEASYLLVLIVVGFSLHAKSSGEQCVSLGEEESRRALPTALGPTSILSTAFRSVLLAEHGPMAFR